MLSGCKGNHSFANNAQYCEKSLHFSSVSLPSLFHIRFVRPYLFPFLPSLFHIRFVRPYLFPFLPSLFHIPFVRYRPLSRSLKADFIRSHRSSPLSPRRRPLTTGDRCLTGASPLVFHCRSAVQRQRHVICCWSPLGGLHKKKFWFCVNLGGNSRFLRTFAPCRWALFLI